MFPRSILFLFVIALFIDAKVKNMDSSEASLVSDDVVISQVYGAGGNSGAAFRNDFVELFNRGAVSRSLTGWAIQYTSSSGTSWSRTDLTGNIAPGQYILVQLASGGATGALLPAADITGTIAMAATAGKVALTNSTTLLTGGCPSGAAIIDLVGYGSSASCFEGTAPTAAPSSTNAVRRALNGCQDSDQNGADFTAAAAAPRNSASPLAPCAIAGGPRFTADDVKFSIVAGEPCSPFSFELRLTNSGNRIQRNNAGPEVVVDFPADLSLVAGSCEAGANGTCVASATKLEWDGTLASGATAVIKWQASTSSSSQPGDRVCVSPVVRYDANDDGSNEATLSVDSCLTVNCQPGLPGIPFPTGSEQSGDRAGSLMVFPVYTSSASRPEIENTSFNLTNTNSNKGVTIHLFFASEDSASVADSFLCLSANQTRSFLASDIDPNTAGYLVAVAVDSRTGCPVNFNYLIGDESISLESNHRTTLLAETFAARVSEPSTCDGTSVSAEIRLDGAAYNWAPRVLAIDGIGSLADGFANVLVLTRLGGSLISGASTLGQISGVLFNEAEQGFSFSISSGRRQLRSQLSDSFPRTAPRFRDVIPSGHTGWMKIWLTTDGAILGALLTAHPQVSQSATAFTGGRLAHRLTLSNRATLTIPVFPPGC